ncbi:MAG: hypothetical protein HN576_04115 [Bacteriovoracaceae bacterium]|nr:hypothetical protein [Bacteriovoracaceae bacterium]
MNPKQQLSEETLSQYQYDKTTQVDKRNPASVSLDSRLKNKRKKGQLREKERKALYKKAKLNQHDLRDLVMQIHSGERKRMTQVGEKVIISDVYQQFYEDVFDRIKEYYPQDAAERFKTYLSLKMENNIMEKEIHSEFNIESRNISEMEHKIQSNRTLPEEQKEKLLYELYFKPRHELKYLYNLRQSELNQNYQSNIRKVLKLAYKEISVDIEDYNLKLKSDYGKWIYYSKDPETGEFLPDDRMNESHPQRPAMFIIDL